MLFSIGQVSKMFNMSHDTLRYYDKIGLVKPSIRKENGYRYYSMKELELLDVISIAKRLNISIKDIQDIIDKENIENYINLLDKQERIIEDQIIYLKNLKDKISKSKEIGKDMKVFSNGNFKDSITTEYIDKKIVFINQTDEIYIGNVSKYKNIMFLFKKDSKNNNLIDCNLMGSEISDEEDKLLEGKQYIKKSFKGKYTVITRKNTYKEIEAFIVDIIQNNKYLNKEFEILVESMFTIFKKEEGSIHFVKIYIPKF